MPKTGGLVIRREQMKMFDEHARRDFEDRVVAHLGRVFPDRCAALGPEAARGSVRLGIERAARHGITIELDVTRFIDIMYLVAPDFDTSAAWAPPILSDKDLSGTEKADQLWQACKNQLAPGESAHE